ncbi:MAG TPA: type II CAAX endopeptidase family protein [Chitinophagaceae bacterium]|nr:type II CAAX endopeptidase family protein [Chitinophagaceae bacterium]
MSKLEKIASLLAIAFCFIFPHFGGGILVYPIIVSVVIFLFIKYISKEKVVDLLFSFKRFEWASVWIGLVGAIMLSAFFRFAWEPIIELILPGEKIDLSDFANITGNTWNYIFILFIAFIVGGFYEEIIFHGFIFTRFEKLFPGKYSTVMAFSLTTILFGAYHFQQGISGVLLTMVAGAVYHLLILKFKRNLWYGVFIHTFFDFIGLTMIYLGYL